MKLGADWLIDPKEVHRLDDDVLGTGSFGRVYRAEWHGLQVAVKQLESPQSEKEAINSFVQEMTIWKSLKFPAIVQLYGGYTTPCLAMVMQYCSGGNLGDLLHSEIPIPLETLLRIASEIASAVLYLHSRHVLHRDLKSFNVLLDDDGSAKLCDFGAAVRKPKQSFPRKNITASQVDHHDIHSTSGVTKLRQRLPTGSNSGLEQVLSNYESTGCASNAQLAENIFSKEKNEASSASNSNRGSASNIQGWTRRASAASPVALKFLPHRIDGLKRGVLNHPSSMQEQSDSSPNSQYSSRHTSQESKETQDVEDSDDCGDALDDEQTHSRNQDFHQERQSCDYPKNCMREYADEPEWGPVGTYAWMAPEVFAQGSYSQASDTFGFGVFLWECVSRKMPWQNRAPVAIMRRILDGQRLIMPRYCQKFPRLVRLINSCWAQNCKDRPNFHFILAELNALRAEEAQAEISTNILGVKSISSPNRSLRSGSSNQIPVHGDSHRRISQASKSKGTHQVHQGAGIAGSFSPSSATSSSARSLPSAFGPTIQRIIPKEPSPLRTVCCPVHCKLSSAVQGKSMELSACISSQSRNPSRKLLSPLNDSKQKTSLFKTESSFRSSNNLPHTNSAHPLASDLTKKCFSVNATPAVLVTSTRKSYFRKKSGETSSNVSDLGCEGEHSIDLVGSSGRRLSFDGTLTTGQTDNLSHVLLTTHVGLPLCNSQTETNVRTDLFPENSENIQPNILSNSVPSLQERDPLHISLIPASRSSCQNSCPPNSFPTHPRAVSTLSMRPIAPTSQAVVMCNPQARARRYRGDIDRITSPFADHESPSSLARESTLHVEAHPLLAAATSIVSAECGSAGLIQNKHSNNDIISLTSNAPISSDSQLSHSPRAEICGPPLPNQHIIDPLSVDVGSTSPKNHEETISPVVSSSSLVSMPRVLSTSCQQNSLVSETITERKLSPHTSIVGAGLDLQSEDYSRPSDDAIRLPGETIPEHSHSADAAENSSTRVLRQFEGPNGRALLSPISATNSGNDSTSKSATLILERNSSNCASQPSFSPSKSSPLGLEAKYASPQDRKKSADGNATSGKLISKSSRVSPFRELSITQSHIVQTLELQSNVAQKIENIKQDEQNLFLKSNRSTGTDRVAARTATTYSMNRSRQQARKNVVCSIL